MMLLGISGVWLSRKWCCRDVGVDVGLMGGTVTQGGDVALDQATPKLTLAFQSINDI